MKKLLTILLSACMLLCICIGITACGGNGSGGGEDDCVHSYSESVTNPTCTERGYTTHICGLCGDSYVDTYINALTHEFIDYVPDNNAKCEVDGTETAICSRQGCNEKDIRTIDGTALTHSFTDYVSDNNATYEKDGTKTAQCTHGCGTSDTVTDVGSMLVHNGLTFKTLSINGTNVYGKVSNTTESFSFINEITTSGKTKFIVSIDIYGVQQVATKTIPLEIGDNTVYITEIVDDEPINFYTVTVRRRPMYNVTFNANGGNSVASQTVEEDTILSSPSTVRQGYTFATWDYDFSKPITKNENITASWNANTNTPYKIEYYLQNLENNEYTLETTESKLGTTDTTVNAEIKTFAHFTHIVSETNCGNVAPDGSTILKVYYTRDKYTVTFNGNGGTLSSGNAIQTVKYQGSAIAPTYNRDGYDFKEFDKTFTNVSGDLLVTAQWNAIFLLSESGNEILGLTEYGVNNYSDVIIPENIDGKDINAIGEQAFWFSTINSVVIPQTVTSVGSYAFAYSSLTAITLPSSNIAFSEYAFLDCNNIKTVYYSGILENWLTSTWQYEHLESSPFFNGADLYIKGEKLTVLDSTNIPKNITTINAMAFYGCSSLEKVDIPSNITKIEGSAFSDCKNLTYLRIPSTVTDCQGCSFNGCISLQTIYFDIVDWKNTYAVNFSNAGKNSDSLVLTIGKNVEIIKSHAFDNSYITEVIFEEESNCREIKEYAFSECSRLKAIQIPDSVTSLGTYVFEQSGLETVTIGSGVSSIDTYAFLGCEKLKEISVNPNNKNYQSIDGSLYQKNSTSVALLQYPRAKESTVFSVSNEINLTSINSTAFLGAKNLSVIVLPKTVSYIGRNSFQRCTPFAGCSSLVSIIVDDSNAYYTSIDGNLYTKDGKTLVAYAPGKTATEFEVPNGVTNIGDYAFRSCDNLKNVTMPNSVTTIGDGAFYDCDSLTSITLPNSVTSIGEWAFSDCDSLTSVVIGDNVTSIEDAVFDDCSRLASVYYKGPASEWMNISIGNYNENLTSATIYYYIENENDVPTDGGNYWHYDENGNVAIWDI